LESNDSGNEDSDNFPEQQIYVINRNEPNSLIPILVKFTSSINNNSLNNNNNNAKNDDPISNSNKIESKSNKRNNFDHMNPLNEQIMALSLFDETYRPIQSGLIESLPTEGNKFSRIIFLL
jgi:hypothetical protein